MAEPRTASQHVVALLATTAVGGCLFDFDSYDPRENARPLACPALGVEENCYGGPANTEGVGRCQSGSRVCADTGWTACAGEVLPGAEDCLNGEDDDCDGDADGDDTDCACTPGQLVDCYSGADSTLGVGVCRRGRRACDEPTAACIGEVVPSLELCGNGLDEDCDGEVDEGCATRSTCFPDLEAQEPQAADSGSAGNVVFGGDVENRIDLGGADLVSLGFVDLFVAKFSGTGEHIWSRRFGGPVNEYLTSLDIASSGDVVMGGRYQGTWDFGATTMPSANVDRMAVWTVDTTGIPLTAFVQDNSDGTSITNGVTGDSPARTFAVGSFTSTLQFGTHIANAVGGSDGFVVRFDRGTLQPVWLRSIGGGTDDELSVITTTSSGDVAVAGSFTGTAGIFAQAVSAGGSDRNSFVSLLSDNTGAAAYVQTLLGSGEIVVRAIEPFNDDVIIVGHYSGDVTFGIGGMTLPTAQGTDPFVARLEASSGDVVWARTATELAGHPTRSQRALAVTTDPAHDRVWVSLAIRGSFDIDGHEVISSTNPGESLDDLVLWRMDGSGTTDLVLRFGDAQDQDSFALAPLLDGGLFLGMGLAGTIDFGAGPHEASFGDPSNVCIALFPAP